MGKYFFTVFMLLSSNALADVPGTGTPPDLPKTLNSFGPNIKWKHSLNDAEGNSKAPDGYIMFYASKQADLGSDAESQLGITDPSKFVDPADNSQFIFKLTQIAELLAKKNCFQMTAYYTYDDNGTPVRVESNRSNIVCKTITAKPSSPLVLTAD